MVGNHSLPHSPISSLAARTAYLFVDLANVQQRGREIFGSEVDVDPVGFTYLLEAGMEYQGSFSSALQRGYFYDAMPTGANPRQPSPVQAELAATEQMHMRYGHLMKKGGSDEEDPKWRQKGVDTLLVLDLAKFTYTGVCQVAHIMSYDTDFEEPIRTIADLGIQIVLYEFTDAKNALPDKLRANADRVIKLDRTAAAGLFDVPRYYVRRNYETAKREKTEPWFTRIAHKAGWAETPTSERATIDVLFGDHQHSSPRDRPWVIAAYGSHQAVRCDRHGRSRTHTLYSHEKADSELRSFLKDVADTPRSSQEAHSDSSSG